MAGDVLKGLPNEISGTMFPAMLPEVRLTDMVPHFTFSCMMNAPTVRDGATNFRTWQGDWQPSPPPRPLVSPPTILATPGASSSSKSEFASEVLQTALSVSFALEQLEENMLGEFGAGSNGSTVKMNGLSKDEHQSDVQSSNGSTRLLCDSSVDLPWSPTLPSNAGSSSRRKYGFYPMSPSRRPRPLVGPDVYGLVPQWHCQSEDGYRAESVPAARVDSQRHQSHEVVELSTLSPKLPGSCVPYCPPLFEKVHQHLNGKGSSHRFCRASGLGWQSAMDSDAPDQIQMLHKQNVFQNHLLAIMATAHRWVMRSVWAAWVAGTRLGALSRNFQAQQALWTTMLVQLALSAWKHESDAERAISKKMYDNTEDLRSWRHAADSATVREIIAEGMHTKTDAQLLSTSNSRKLQISAGRAVRGTSSILRKAGLSSALCRKLFRWWATLVKNTKSCHVVAKRLGSLRVAASLRALVRAWMTSVGEQQRQEARRQKLNACNQRVAQQEFQQNAAHFSELEAFITNVDLRHERQLKQKVVQQKIAEEETQLRKLEAFETSKDLRREKQLQVLAATVSAQQEAFVHEQRLEQQCEQEEAQLRRLEAFTRNVDLRRERQLKMLAAQVSAQQEASAHHEQRLMEQQSEQKALLHVLAQKETMLSHQQAKARQQEEESRLLALAVEVSAQREELAIEQSLARQREEEAQRLELLRIQAQQEALGRDRRLAQQQEEETQWCLDPEDTQRRHVQLRTEKAREQRIEPHQERPERLVQLQAKKEARNWKLGRRGVNLPKTQTNLGQRHMLVDVIAVWGARVALQKEARGRLQEMEALSETISTAKRKTRLRLALALWALQAAATGGRRGRANVIC